MNANVTYLVSACLLVAVAGCQQEPTQQVAVQTGAQALFNEQSALAEAGNLVATADRVMGRAAGARQAVRFTREQNVFFPSALAVNFQSTPKTVTLPLYKGIGPSGKPTYYIITEAANFNVAKLLGVNFSPKLIFGRDTEGSQDVTVESGLIKFKGDVNFGPARVLQPGTFPATFPPSVNQPGAIGDAEYSPLLVLPSGSVINAPIVANETGTHDHLVSIDYIRGTVVFELLDGFQGGDQYYFHLVTDSSDPGAATIERGNYAPKLGKLPAFGQNLPTDESALLGFSPVSNGETGLNNPKRQGLNSTILDGDIADPINIFPLDPDNNRKYNNNYSPMWDAHLNAWTQDAIQAGKRRRITSIEDLQQLVKEGSVVNFAGNVGPANGFIAGLRPTNVIINCPVIAQPKKL